MEVIQAGLDLSKITPEFGINYDEKIEQINFIDSRFYKIGDCTYYPSMTTILQYFPKGKYFEQWLKEVGTNADIISEKAAKEGKLVHDLIELGIKTGQLKWLTEEQKAKYSSKVWEQVTRFHDFWKTYSPKPILVEEFVYSHTEKFGGTLDLLIELDNQVWLLDIKTSKHLYRSYDLQLAGYAKALKECANISIDKAGIIWLKSKSKYPSRTSGKYQGKNWEIKEVVDLDLAFKSFQNINTIYKYDNPICKPLFKTLPTILNF